MNLTSKKCTPCTGKETAFNNETVHQYLQKVPGWQVTEHDKSICKKYRFKDFATAFDFVNKVARIAEQEQHHPDITFGWGYCDITLMTHAIDGLQKNDFIVAAKIDAT